MTVGQQVADKLLNQCLNIIGSEDNQNKLKANLIDPLVTYFKQRLRFFYVIITLLLCLILITNLFLTYQLWGLRGQILQMASVVNPTQIVN